MARNSNFKPCPHVTSWKNRIETKTGVIFLCDDCQAALEERLSDPVMLRGMMKSVMASPEVWKMQHERENIRLERELMDTVAAAYMVAGYPRRLALAAPVVA